MSFFGFDTTLPRDKGHQKSAPGFGATQDAFDGLSSAQAANNDEMFIYSAGRVEELILTSTLVLTLMTRTKDSADD
jgi:hypothetical protein